ncbi:YqaI family protein [Peribacillus alkalitolerans]|uniref:YqaI family protein n=1 Tax=Peribacillus alkalitolerans TaxID=1550385 RepID=UPI001F0870BA|nr:hypothetical protein [Peribacillus alkalitolerans]
MPNIEHPAITQVQKNGYPNSETEIRHFGIDYFGDEILQNDKVVIDEEEIILNQSRKIPF